MVKRSFYQFIGGLCCFAAFCSLATADDELRVFSLVNADCNEMASVLDAISEGEIIMAADRRTNSLVVKAPAESLDVIEALLLKLDSVVSHPKIHPNNVDAEKIHGKRDTMLHDLELRERAEIDALRR